MEVITYSYTNKGGRSHNEDSLAHQYEPGKGVWVVADGLGGHACGEVASALATEFILKAVSEAQEINEPTLLGILKAANAHIIKSQAENIGHRMMRTTVVSAVTDGEKIYSMNAGDSRFYYFKNGCLYQQTRDHSVSQMAVNMGEISKTQIRFHDDRNKLLKVLGNEADLRIERLDDPIPMESGDAFLLCSDGFWEYVYETEMEIDLIKSGSPKEWLEFMINRLLLRVSNSNDNFSAIGCFIR